jgi:plasmid stabilization system protein ParE
MELKIKWTDFSKKELKKIFEYYKENASITVARKLKKQPTIGQEEDLLKSDSREFRYLVYKNYKIIYLVSIENNSIEIFDVFDTRQNPIKIKRGN